MTQDSAEKKIAVIASLFAAIIAVVLITQYAVTSQFSYVGVGLLIFNVLTEKFINLHMNMTQK